MILATAKRQSHCTVSTCWLNHAILLCLTVATALAGPQQQPEATSFRQELASLVQSGRIEQALARVQSALRQAPDDASVRQEYLTLHLALARNWLAQRRFNDCSTALDAILAVEPEHEPALSLRRELAAARQRAAQQLPEIDRLLRIALFESALDRIHEVKALRADLTPALTGRERAAWLGAAGDHYLAGNFHEAFALYEHLLSLHADLPPALSARWSIALALALSEGDFSRPLHPDVSGRLRAHALPRITDPSVAQAISGLLSEWAGQPIDAGRAYAEALGVPWQLPPADQRRITVAHLRQQVLERLGALYAADRHRRHDGAWQIVLPVWKHRQTEHFDVYARNDLVAERAAEAAEFHFAGIADWLGLPRANAWEPRCELRIHATMQALQQATGTSGATHALSQTRLQAERVLLREINLVQDDPWLLGATLPHELTLVLLVDACRGGKLPSVLETGLALHAEPPARRLEFRRRLHAIRPQPDPLAALAAPELPSDQQSAFALCDALTGWLLRQAAIASPRTSDRSPVAMLLHTFRDGFKPGCLQALGWSGEQAARDDWSAWYETRGAPPRMPLMILKRPSAGGGNDGN